MVTNTCFHKEKSNEIWMKTFHDHRLFYSDFRAIHDASKLTAKYILGAYSYETLGSKVKTFTYRL